MRWDRTKAEGAVRAVAVLGLGALMACGSSNSYAPRTPISGADAAESPQQTTSRAAQREAEQRFLNDFLDEVAAACEGEIRPVAVFPALSRPGGTTAVTGLGTFLMEVTAEGLRTRGVANVLSGEALRSRLRDWNRPEEYLCTEADAVDFARFLGAGVVVAGTARLDRTEIASSGIGLDVSWVARHLEDDRVLSRYEESLWGGALGVALGRRTDQASDWRVCRPDLVQLSLQRELEIQSRRVATALCVEHADRLRAEDGASLRIRVLPTALPGSVEPAATLRRFAEELERCLDRDGANGESRCDILGRSYADVAEARAAFDELRRSFEASPAGSLAVNVATTLRASFLDNGLVPMTEVAGARTVADSIGVIREEALASRLDGSVREESIGFVSTDGTQLLVRSRVRSNLDGDVGLEVQLVRIDGETLWMSQETPVPLGAPFQDDLAERMGR